MDPIETLPADNSKKPTSTELATLQKYFGNKKFKNSMSDLKNILIATILFLLMSTTYFDMAMSYLPYADKFWVRWPLKALIFACVLFALVVAFG